MRPILRPPDAFARMADAPPIAQHSEAGGAPRRACSLPAFRAPARRPEVSRSKMARSLDVPEFRSARESHPRLVRALNRVGFAFVRGRRIEADDIWRAAATGALEGRAPTPEAAEALAVLLDDLARNVRLNALGYVSAKDDTVRLARTHLRVHAALEAAAAREAAGRGAAADPDPSADAQLAAAERLAAPVFILGWPRTGTTFLHQLLASDPATRTIPYWESFDPIAPPAGTPDRRVERLDRMLGQVRFLAPNYDAIHPMTATSPEECVAFFMNEFRTLQFDFQYRVPGYARWLRDQDAGLAYDLYRRQLSLVLAARPGGARLVLKDPTHLVHFETIVERFPGAKFVLTHRDPAEALSSIASLTAYTRALFTDEVDPQAIGEELLAGYWPAALARSREIAAKLPADRVVDVRHADLRADPLGTAERIHRTLDLPFDGSSRAAMARFLDERARTRVGRHHHALATFGWTREAVRDRLSDYCESVGV